MLDILQSIMKLSNDKKDTLLYFLDDDTCDRVRRYQYIETKDLYLNDSLICINKSTLKIDFTGVIHRMKDDEIILSPPVGGTKFRYFQINPLPEGVPEDMLQEIAADAFEKVGAAHHRVDTSKHPAMHKTETVDYIILLKGDVTLILDEEEVDIKPFDVVVQRGTNHAWVNNGTEPALLIAVLIDSDIK